MSGYPSKEQVSELRELAEKRKRILAGIRHIDEQIKRRETLAEAYQKTSQQMVTLLERMDCAARGNMGWENRITEMLTELVTGQYE